MFYILSSNSKILEQQLQLASLTESFSLHSLSGSRDVPENKCHHLLLLKGSLAGKMGIDDIIRVQV